MVECHGAGCPLITFWLATPLIGGAMYQKEGKFGMGKLLKITS